MKIVYDGIINSLQSNGGITVYFKELVTRLPSGNFDWYSYDNKIGDVGVKSIDLKGRLFERYRDCLLPDINKDISPIFHSSYYRLPKEHMPVVTTVHDFTYEKFVSGPAKWIHTWQKNRAVKHSDLIICVSENTAKDLQYYCSVPSDKIRIIHNGVSDKYHSLTPTKTNTNKVIFVGARGGYKNFDIAVKVISRLPHLELSVVGGGEFTDKELSLLNQHLPHRYHWLGRLSDEALNEAYNSAYALLYPSSYEGFGIPILEAMRAGCPVVAVGVSSIPEVAGDAAILVSRPSVDELVEGLVAIDNERSKFIEFGFQQAAKFSWDKCYQETLNVYKELNK
ncbi:mannosyltransferase [Yersinia entomophaga]|uniref:Mannosyltransferase n=1 Tax=Yersinia entomophaga TaxID=935293 RepID=A0ABM6BG57_YERET|nr:glycosyltransferase family 1 protein [Yersinia entomophaga]ANI28366.1 mannosyltransferase [Yersinia entomophaga]OWF88173.1 mannosyltransferase [Yersinia entomophaga]